MQSNPHHTSPKKLLDLFSVIFLVFLAIIATLYFKPNFLIATTLFFGVPSLYLIWRKPSNLKKATIAGLLFGVLWGFSFDFVAEFNHAWSWSTGESLLFPGFLFGVVSLDIMVWFFLWIFTIIAFYEYFVEYDFSKRISANIKYSVAFGALVLVSLLLIFFTRPDWLRFSYTYLWLGSLAFAPFLYVILKRPKLLPKLLEVVPFFVFLYLSFEIVALQLGLWDFTGQYIGVVELLGMRFSFEEMFFWIMASSAIAASYHELYIDDQR